MWPRKLFNIFVDITTHCNAGCPQCHRTNPDGLKKADWLPLISWSLEDFKKAYRPSTLKLTNTLDICGTWGDPIMNKDIFKICEYIMSIEGDFPNKPSIIINTNGSIRDEKWWWDLGVLCGDRLRVVFAVDGKDQEQHQLYRKFTVLDKVLENMKSLSMTKATATAQTIVFKHNQDDLEEIRELSLKYGAKEHLCVWTDRYMKKNPSFEYTNPDGTKYALEMADKNPEKIERDKPKHQQTNKNCITCQWMDTRRVLVNPDGQVLPCCYIANPFYTGGAKALKNETMLNYNKEEHNIFNKPLEDILAESDWFNEQLFDNWNSDNPIKQCVKFCSNKDDTFNKIQRVKT